MDITIKAITERQVEQIHELTLNLLSSQGITIKCETARETFEKHGAKVSGEQVFIPNKMVEEALNSAPSSFMLYSRNPEKTITIGHGLPTKVAPCAGVPFIQENGQQRLVTFDDFKNILKLTHTSPVLDMAITSPVCATHSNAHEAYYIQIYYALTMTDLPLIGQGEGAKLASDMIRFSNFVNGQSDKTNVICICNSLSPLAWDAKMLEGIRVYAENGQAINISCCSMAGSTAPIYLAGGIVQANAEVLTGIIYAQLVNPGTPVVYGTTSSVMDMSEISLVLGTPEYSLISTGCAQMAAYYKLPFRSGGGLTDSKTLDAQAGMESAMNLFVSMNNGVNFMLQSLGILEAYMSMSLEKWVMDEEIISRIRRMQKGIGEIPDNLTDIFKEGIEDGFLGHESTYESFRSEFYWPKLGDRKNFEAWKKSNADYIKTAGQYVKERLNSYVCPDLPIYTTRELKNMIEKASGGYITV